MQYEYYILDLVRRNKFRFKFELIKNHGTEKVLV